ALLQRRQRADARGGPAAHGSVGGEGARASERRAAPRVVRGGARGAAGFSARSLTAGDYQPALSAFFSSFLGSSFFDSSFLSVLSPLSDLSFLALGAFSVFGASSVPAKAGWAMRKAPASRAAAIVFMVGSWV